MTGDRSRSELLRTTLPNGLRVLLAPWYGTPRVAVTVHYRVGFRVEPPGREGFAHLFEHLMFRGSESLPDGRFYDHVHRLGGTANGSTHQDFTDYYQVVPASALEQALFSEADRMRAPKFTSGSLAEQLSGVEEEIRQATVGRPYGGFPWPLMPEVLYDTFANAHDGYGDVELLRRTTPDDCAEFFDAYYAPANAVLTLVGDFDPEHARGLIEHHFGDIRARPLPSPPDLREPEPAADRWARCSEPGIPAPAVALGYRLPNPEDDLSGYLAHVVLARLLAQRGLADPGWPRPDSSCGFFGLLDAKDPDTLVLASLLAPGVTPERLVAAVNERWDEWAEGGKITDAVDEAVRVLISEHHRRHSDLQTRGRALGRLEVLFGRGELLDELPGLLAKVSPSQVARAARSLRSARKAVLVIEPAADRIRPRPVTAPAPPHERPGPPAVHRDAVRLARTPAGPRPLPALLRSRREPRLEGLSDTALNSGLRLVTVRDARAPLVEIRLRVPLRTQGWACPDHLELLVHLIGVRTGAARLAQAIGGEFLLSTDGQWMDVTGHAPRARLDDWLNILADVVAPTVFPQPVVPPPGAVTRRGRLPHRTCDDALRLHWLGGAAADGPIDLAELHRSVMSPLGASLVAVGDLDPVSFTASVEKALLAWWAADISPPPRLALSGTGDLLALRQGGLAEVHVTLCTVRPPERAGEPARYLATAIFGSYMRSRLVTRIARRGPAAYEAYAGRETFLDTHRAYVRARIPDGLVKDALDDIRDEARRLTADPPSATEVDLAREFCAAQMLSVFDSPSVLADLLRQTVSSGLEPGWLERLPGLLREVPVADVAEAGAELYGTPRLAGVVLGDIDPGRFAAETGLAVTEIHLDDVARR
ncbi:Predicted Zn-dependent peptidase [Streptosporangium subroseum]|uniref:Predicted Zn-dependent peptidase n=1 Tax=Streptosporangium subroseum TaxID=106412 RepID=A0A239L370_9ACTN|nr:M16 family metallopeptidase [Streptosporangium subroseum]SNT25036.1 Predicted Zn-dependent peptidase [Streptosporangium subroseum]